MRNIVVFDFDGTLTCKDTFLEIIRFSCGSWKFYKGFLLYSPLLLLMKLHLYPNWKAKEKVFSYFFRGWKYTKFVELSIAFADKVEKIKRDVVVAKLQEHIKNGDSVYVISASIEEWIRPWCEKYCVSGVIGTKIEVDQKGLIVGKFLTKNCYGREKIYRLLEVEPSREEYSLCVYGDSRGDKEILEFADKGFYIKSNLI